VTRCYRLKEDSKHAVLNPNQVGFVPLPRAGGALSHTVPSIGYLQRRGQTVVCQTSRIRAGYQHPKVAESPAIRVVRLSTVDSVCAFPTITIPKSALILITASEFLSSRQIIQRLLRRTELLADGPFLNPGPWTGLIPLVLPYVNVIHMGVQEVWNGKPE
jgi:hypothetical protein